MGCIENREVLNRFIRTIFDEDTVVNNEWRTIVQAVYANGPIGMRVTLDFMRENATIDL